VKHLSHRDTARAKRIRNGLKGIRESCNHWISGHLSDVDWIQLSFSFERSDIEQIVLGIKSNRATTTRRSKSQQSNLVLTFTTTRQLLRDRKRSRHREYTARTSSYAPCLTAISQELLLLLYPKLFSLNPHTLCAHASTKFATCFSTQSVYFSPTTIFTTPCGYHEDRGKQWSDCYHSQLRHLLLLYQTSRQRRRIYQHSVTRSTAQRYQVAPSPTFRTQYARKHVWRD
jgi:hypothetical protein